MKILTFGRLWEPFFCELLLYAECCYFPFQHDCSVDRDGGLASSPPINTLFLATSLGVLYIRRVWRGEVLSYKKAQAGGHLDYFELWNFRLDLGEVLV